MPSQVSMPDQSVDTANPVLLDHHAVRRRYGWSRPTTYRRTATGDIKAVKIGGRTFWFLESIDNFINRQPAPMIRTGLTGQNSAASAK